MEAEHRQQAEMNTTTSNSSNGTKLKRERDTIPECENAALPISPVQSGPDLARTHD
jgi:hypothetical protein